MNYIDIINETITDGEGLRISIYVSGCTHYCKECHNSFSWNFNQGTKITPEFITELIQKFKSDPLLDGITFSGGDPLHPDNAKDLLWILQVLKEASINIWVYTGYTYEELLENDIQKACLEYIDVLVDGPFILEKKDPELLFRGSSNQRILCLKKGNIIRQSD